MTKAEFAALLHLTLGLRPGMQLAVLKPVEAFTEALHPLPPGVELVEQSKTGLDVTVFFAHKKLELVECLPKLIQGMAVTGKLWICYPTVGAGVTSQIPSEEFVRIAGLEMGLVDDRADVLIPNWNGIRFIWKMRPRIERPQQATG